MTIISKRMNHGHKMWIKRDGSRFFVPSFSEHTIQVFDGESLQLIDELQFPKGETDIIQQLSFGIMSPDGRFIVSKSDGYDPTSHCYLWNIETGEYHKSIASTKPKLFYNTYWRFVGNSPYDDPTLYHQPYRHICFDCEAKKLITITESGEVFVWSTATHKRLWAVGASSHMIVGFALTNQFGRFVISERLMNKSPRGNWSFGRIGMFTTLGDKIYFYNVGSTYWSLPHSRPVGYYGKTERLASGARLRMWNIYAGELIHEFETDQVVDELLFSPSDSLLVGSEMTEGKFYYEYDLESVCIWDVATGKKRQTLPDPAKPIGFTQNDRYLAVQQGDHQIRFWDVQTASWHEDYTFDGVITSAQMTDKDMVIALEKRGHDNPEWYVHQIILD